MIMVYQNILKGPTCFKNPYIPTSISLTYCPRRLAATLNVNIGVSDFLNQIQAATIMYAPKSDQFWFHNKLLETVMDSHAPHEKRIIPPIQLPYMNGQFKKAINIKGIL